MKGRTMQLRWLGRSGLQPTQLALGTGSFGIARGHGADPAESEAIFNAYADAGGNFVDVADVDQIGQSEEILSSLLAGRRQNFLLGLKFARGATSQADRPIHDSSRRAIISAVETSLRRLKTDYIDIYWIHRPSCQLPAEEILRGIEDLTCSGKIIYAGLSTLPAWRVARVATLAEVSRVASIAAIRCEHSLVHRGRKPTFSRPPTHWDLASLPCRRSVVAC